MRKLIPVIAGCMILLGAIYSLFTQIQPESTNPANSTDRMDLAMEQEFMLTMDPALNRVPRERLLTALSFKEQKLRQMDQLNTAVTGVNWQERGPNNIGGRSRVTWFDLSDAPNYRKVWAAGVSGGLWLTNDITIANPVWNKVNDLFENMAICSFAQDPLNNQNLYFGTGEGWFNIDAVEGLGIWKSSDGGTNWAQLPSTNISNFYYITKMVVDANGHVYACTRRAGLQKSIDGGATWTKVLGLGTNGGVSDRAADIEIAPNGDLYCSLGIYSTGKIYRSTDNGANWTDISPAGNARRIELAVAPNNSDILYALFHSDINDDCDAIRRYQPSTTTWTNCTVPTIIDQGNNSNFARSQAFYNLIASVDPNNSSSIYIGGIDALRSDDAGATWTQMSTWSLFNAPGFTAAQNVHADHHAITYVPGSSSRALWGTDGGLYYTTDADIMGAGNKPSWANKNGGFNVTQYYSGAIHPTLTNYFLGGTQDNGSHKFTAAGLNNVTFASGGDGGFCHIDQDNGNVQITSYVFNHYFVSTDGGTNFTERFKNSRGGFINPTDYDNGANILYAGDNAGNYFRWTSPETNGTSDQVAVAAFAGGTITHVSVSPISVNRVYFGLSNGSVVMVDNANTGTTGTGVVIKPTVAGSVSCIAIDPADENHMLVTSTTFGVTHVYESINALAGSPTWTSVQGNLPDMPVRWAVFDPRNADWAILATELGVWSTDDLNAGATDWDPTNSGLANVRVDMLQYRSSDRTLMAATHGRGVFTAIIPNVTTPDINFLAATTSATEQTLASSSCRNYRDYNVTMSIANPPTGDATVTINVQAGNTAIQGLDFDYTTNGNFAAPTNSVVFLNGATDSKTITVRIYDDTEVEPLESFTLEYTISGATNAQPGAGAQTHSVIITDNDVAPVGSSSGTFTIGTPTFLLTSDIDGTGTGEPFDAKLTSRRVQFLYKASELTAAGMTAGDITSIQLNVAFKNSTRPYQNMQVKMGATAVNYLIDGPVNIVPVSTVRNAASFTTAAGWNTIALDIPFNWNGTSNIAVEICYDNGSADPANFADVVYGYSDGGTPGQANMMWQDDITCATGFSVVDAYGDGVKPQFRFGTTTAGTPIATTLISRSEFLGPNSDLYFYTAGGDLMARVRNLSNHDYGCTQVEIDRAGTATTAFWNNTPANFLMNKTFRVVPTTNNPTGSYEITLYLTQNEVDGWQTATGQAFNNIQLIKVQGQILSVTPGNPSGAGTVEVVTPTRGTFGPNYTLTYTFNNGFSGFGAGVAGSALPVRLLEFTGKLNRNTIALEWKTASEQNSKGFDIERSTDGSQFRKVGYVPAAGNSSSIRAYDFTDADIAQDNNYYRLKQIDLDGKYEYSKIVHIRNPAVSRYPFRILGNPVQDYLDIQFGEAPIGRLQVRLTDVSGKVLLNWQNQQTGQTRVRIDLSPLHLPAGVYIVQAKIGNQQFSEKVIKQ